MTEKSKRRIKVALVVIDGIAVALALLAAYWLRIGSGLLPERAFEEFAIYLRVSLLIVPIWLVIFAANNLYDVRTVLGGLDVYIDIAKSGMYAIVAVIMLGYWVRIATLSRGWLILLWFFGVLFVGAGRFLFRQIIYWLRRQGHLRTRTLIVGANEQGMAIARQFRAASSAGVEIVGFIDDFLPAGAMVKLTESGPQDDCSLRVLGGPDRLQDVAAQYDVAEVVVVSNAVAWETFQEIMQDASLAGDEVPFEIRLSPGFYEILTTGVQVTHEAHVPLLLVNRQRITGFDALLKSGLDYGLAALNLVIALPLMGLIGVALRWNKKGPALERHRVLASGGGTFTTWKFHTGLGHTPRPLFAHPLIGTVESERDMASGVAAATQVSGLQRFLFNTGLDKMPQLINILRGEMSLVGPRTVSVGQADVHSTWLPNLLTVKPGITGPWAVGEKRTLADEMRLTMYYIRNWTIWLDLQILLQTAQRVLRLERGKAQMPDR
ncbi:MAG: sugar transferase [Chloroflexota bacterium]|nr:sugar transferase [Chloroflexota bacterium]